MISKSFKAVSHLTSNAKRLTYLQTMCIAAGAKSRQEKDTFGPIEVPGDKYWGA